MPAFMPPPHKYLCISVAIDAPTRRIPRHAAPNRECYVSSAALPHAPRREQKDRRHVERLGQRMDTYGTVLVQADITVGAKAYHGRCGGGQGREGDGVNECGGASRGGGRADKFGCISQGSGGAELET